MHLVTLSFDDGFEKSNLKIAEIFEKHSLSACFNVVATGHLKSFSPQGAHPGKRGDFQLWNELQTRGHEIMPHGFKHADKSRLPFAEAQKLIINCLAVFESELDFFDSHLSVFNFPYNRSTPELEEWLPTIINAFRTSGSGLNPLPHKNLKKLTTTGFGPNNCEKHLEEQLEKLLSKPSGWLIYNTHGLDEEGYGPIRAGYLDDFLGRLASIESVKVLPVGRALRTYG